MPVRVHITAEGQTEERFVKDVLSPYLGERGVWADVRCVLTSRNKRARISYRGGWRLKNAYATAKKDIFNWMKEDRNPDAVFTTMFDLYALPDDFPDSSKAKTEPEPYRKAAILEKALSEDINAAFGDKRFVPYIQLHEFESLLLANPQCLEYEFLEYGPNIRRLVEMVQDEGGNPELIDDGPNTAPSKRIIAEIPEYEHRKATAGPSTAGRIGIETLKCRCKHFSEWIQNLIDLAG